MTANAAIGNSLRNRFLRLITSKKNIKSLPKERKKQVVNTIIQDIEGTNIFIDDATELDVFEEDQFEKDLSSGKVFDENVDILSAQEAVKELSKEIKNIIFIDPFSIASLSSNERVERKQKELGITCGREKNEKRQDLRFGRTLLHEAIIMRNINLVREHVKTKNLYFVKDNNGETPLELAYQEGYVAIIEILELEF